MNVLVEVVREAWDSIFNSNIGGALIGRDIFPEPQIMGFLLHELVALKLALRFPGVWCRNTAASDKDLVYLPDPVAYSIEIKTTSLSTIHGNRSSTRKPSVTKKEKSGYYLAIRFEKFSEAPQGPQIKEIRFGWLDHDDWQGQKADTGQASHPSREAKEHKLYPIYTRPKVKSRFRSTGSPDKTPHC